MMFTPNTMFCTNLETGTYLKKTNRFNPTQKGLIGPQLCIIFEIVCKD